MSATPEQRELLQRVADNAHVAEVTVIAPADLAALRAVLADSEELERLKEELRPIAKMIGEMHAHLFPGGHTHRDR